MCDGLHGSGRGGTLVCSMGPAGHGPERCGTPAAGCDHHRRAGAGRPAAAPRSERHHGPAQPDVRAGRAGRADRHGRRFSQQRSGPPPSLFLFEREDFSARALRRQVARPRPVRQARAGYAGVQHSRQHARLHLRHRLALVWAHRRGRHPAAARPGPGGLHRAPLAHAPGRVGPGTASAPESRRRSDGGGELPPQAAAAPALATQRGGQEMGRLLIRACAGGVLLLAGGADAYELDLSVDLRAVSSNASNSRLEGGLGKLRYDATDDGLRLGYLRLGYRVDLTQTLRLTAEAVAYGDHDVNPLDLTELYAEWRPLAASSWRSRLKVGAFYPEISLENRMRGWRSPYTLSSSAINTWVGEELRTIGAEYSLELLGRSRGHAFDLTFNAAAFGWNDTAGTVLASRGWGLHDRQSTLFGRFANGGQALPQRTLFFDDLDKRAGYYAGTAANYRGLLEARLHHYDNRARLSPDDPRIQADSTVAQRVFTGDPLALRERQWQLAIRYDK